MKNLLLPLVLYFFSVNVYAQNIDPCKVPEDRKLHKKLDQLTDVETPLSRKRFLIKEILDEYPGFIPAIYERSLVNYELFRRGENTLHIVNRDFKTVETACEEKFPLIAYYKGKLQFEIGEYNKAETWLKKFISLENELSEETRLNHIPDAKNLYDLCLFYNQLQTDTLNVKITRVPVVNVNTSGEYLPMISPDNSLLFFTRKTQAKRLGERVSRDVEELVFSKISESGDTFSLPEKMEPPFNEGNGNYGGLSITVDNKHMYITQCILPQPGEEKGVNCDIFYTRKRYLTQTEEGYHYMWEELKNLQNINDSTGWESQPSISADNNVLFYAKYAEETRGIDIYYSIKNEDGEWMPGEPIPGKVNTSGNDKAPFIHPDGTTLYFSSDGHPGAGGYDIYISHLQENGTWGQPFNIGMPVNTVADDHGLVVSTNGKFGFYASNQFNEDGSFDIVKFELPENLKPEEVAVLKGKVDNVGFGTTIDIETEDGKKLKQIELTDTDGHYAAILKKDDLKKPLLVNMKKKGHAYQSRLVDSNMINNGFVNLSPVEIPIIEEGKPYKLHDIFFDFDQSALSSKSEIVISRFADFLKENPDYNVEIRGHTDNTGEHNRNMALSSERASEVKKYLIKQGIQPNRLFTKGLGETMPVASNATKEGRAQNRRTEFVLYSE